MDRDEMLRALRTFERALRRAFNLDED